MIGKLYFLKYNPVRQAGSGACKRRHRAEVTRIKDEPGKDIWLFGGASLTTSLLRLNLVDEIALAIHPVILGAGKRLFEHIPKRIHLHLTDSKRYSSGLVMLSYGVKNE